MLIYDWSVASLLMTNRQAEQQFVCSTQQRLADHIWKLPWLRCDSAEWDPALP